MIELIKKINLIKKLELENKKLKKQILQIENKKEIDMSKENKRILFNLRLMK